MRFLSDHRDRLRQQPAASRHGLRKDHRRHHCPLSAPLRGSTTHFLMGNDEHSQNVFKQGRRAGEGSARVLRRDGAGVPRRVEAARHLVRRLHSHHRSQAPLPGVQKLAQAVPRQRRHLRGRRTRAGIARAASPSSRKKIWSTASVRSTRPSRSGSRRRTGSSACRNISSRC